MKISVITVCFNSARTISETLRSVNAQTHPEVEHLIIDGGSTDGTLALVQELGHRVRVLVSEPDAGIYDAMNKGLKLATGEVVGFLNADDVYADETVLARIAACLARTGATACYGDLLYLADEPARIVRYWKSRPYQAGMCTRGWMPAHPTFYCRREAYERLGYFDTALRIAADFEMSFRLLEVNRLPVAYLPEILVHMRTGGASNASFRNVMISNIEASRSLRKHGYRGGVLFMLRKMTSKLVQLINRPATPRG